MTQICHAQAAKCQTSVTTLTASRIGWMAEACFATRAIKFCLGDISAKGFNSRSYRSYIKGNTRSQATSAANCKGLVIEEIITTNGRNINLVCPEKVLKDDNPLGNMKPF